MDGLSGEKNPNWKGGKFINSDGYVLILKPDHHRADASGYVREHILYAEQILGKPLPPQAIIHHVNGDKELHKGNIAICENHAYHRLLHCRQIALRACGHATWRQCWICKTWDDPRNLYIRTKTGSFHRTCRNEHYREKHRRYMRQYRQNRKQ